jgi:hypothetical protein
MEENKEGIFRSLSLLCFNLFIASLVLVVASYFSLLVLDIIVSADIIFGIGMFLGFLSLVFWENSKGKWVVSFHKDKHVVKQREESDSNLFFRVVPYLFLLMLLIISINQFWKNPFINAQMMRITILAITFGAVTFWRNRGRVENEIEKEKEDEEKSESKRYAEFDKKFPRISRIWGIKHFVRWMYKEGWWYSGALIGIVILGFVLRVWNLGKLGFWVDETQSIAAARSLLEIGQPIYAGNLLYLRAFLYTLLNSLSIFFFGLGEFSIRIVPVLFGTAIIFLTYFILREVVSKRYALLGAILIALSDFAILYSRYNRFYIALTFFVPLLIFLYYKFFFKKQGNKFFYLLVICAILIPGFDSKAIIFLPIIFLINIFLKRDIFRNKKFWVFCFLSLLSFSTFYYIESKGILPEGSTQAYVPISFLPGVVSEMIYPHWDNFFFSFLYNFYPIVFVLVLLGLVYFLVKKPNNLRDSFSLIIIVYLFFNLLFLAKYATNIQFFHWDQRHISFLFSLFIFSGVIVLNYFSKILKTKVFKILLILSLVLAIINISGINSVINTNYGDSLLGTNLQVMGAETSRGDYKTPYDYVNANYLAKDIIIDTENNFALIYLNHSVDFILDVDDNSSRLSALISNNSRVWIIDITYNMERYHAKYRWGGIYNFLESNKDHIIYYGLDNKTRVYLFEKDK